MKPHPLSHCICLFKSLMGFLFIYAGLNRCGKSCRLRWLNYLRPNIKRGNISDQEEDLILRLHKLLGNRYFIFHMTSSTHLLGSQLTPKLSSMVNWGVRASKTTSNSPVESQVLETNIIELGFE